jgi:hypothetical protein
MNGEVKVEEARKELQGIVKSHQDAVAKEREAKMSETERKALEAERAEKARKEQEDKAKSEESKKKDEAILAKKPEERNEEEKKRAEVLEEERRKAEEAKLTTTEKIEKVKEASQKRIDELANRLKQMEDQKSQEAKALKDEISALKQQNEELSKKIQQPISDREALRARLAKAERDRTSEYLEADKDLPRSERREMSKDELEAWLLDDMVSAQEWMVERNQRRTAERNQDAQALQGQVRVQELAKRQDASLKRVLEKHPELKDPNSDKAKLLRELMEKADKETLLKDNGPELLAVEMEKRMNKSADTEQTPEQKENAELRKQLDELQARLQALENGDEGISSTAPRTRKTDDKPVKNEELLVSTMKSAGASEDAIKEAVKQYREKQGA